MKTTSPEKLERAEIVLGNLMHAPDEAHFPPRTGWGHARDNERVCSSYKQKGAIEDEGPATVGYALSFFLFSCHVSRSCMGAVVELECQNVGEG